MTEELTRDRVSYWASCDVGYEDVTGELLMKRAELEVEEKQYQRHPDLEPSLAVSNQHADSFVRNMVMVLAEIPVLLTRRQWLERHLPEVERGLAHAQAALVEAESAEAIEEAEHDVAFYEEKVTSYRDELAFLT